MALFHTNVLDPQIKALPTVDTASGSVATFETDMTENLVEVKCQIVAQQSGSGTPSPDNVRPIITYSEMNVSHTGKNIITGKLSGANISPAGKIIVDADYDMYYAPIKQGVEYVITAQNRIWGFFEDVPQQQSISYDGQRVLSSTFTFTAPITGYVCFRTSTADTTPQCEYGSVATAYEPYNGTTSNIPFGQTVANGVLDVTTGKLRVTYGIVDLGSFSWTYSTVSKWFYNYTLDIKSGTTNMLSSIYKFEDFTTLYGDITIDNSMSCSLHATPSIVIRNSAYTDATTFKTAMSGVQLVYELATPIDIQLDSITLQALLNENNIWCDTNGDTEVKYLLTVGKKIS